MAVASPSTVQEVVFYGFCFLLSIGVGETLRRLLRIEKKQDEQKETHAQCRLILLSKADFDKWKITDLKEWKDGRQDLWDAVNHHSHEGISGQGKVIKTD